MANIDMFEVISSPGLKSSQILRRHMDLAKYIDLLRTQSLYFRRADKFPDRFEGALTPVIRRAIDDAYQDGHTDENADAFYRRARAGSRFMLDYWSTRQYGPLATLW